MKIYEKAFSTEIPVDIEYDEYHIYVYTNVKVATTEEKLNNGFESSDTVYSFTITEYEKNEYSVGMKVAGNSFQPTPDSTERADKGAEIFNDYRKREYDSDGVATQGNIATGKYSHSEGTGTTATGDYGSHSEGYKTRAEGKASHSEGEGTVAEGNWAHAEGKDTKADYYGHSEGLETVAGNTCHSEGHGTTTEEGIACHSEGYRTSAKGIYAHAEGSNTSAENMASHAEGCDTVAWKKGAHAEGIETKAAYASHSAGYQTIADNFQTVVGVRNDSASMGKGGEYATADSLTTDGSLFMVGNGASETARSNAFRVSTAGTCYGLSAFASSGADYAEYFEWLDKNSNNEDRRGLFVTLDGEKIRIATSEDDYILGIISAVPVIVGDIHSEVWHDMYLRDVFGQRITEVVEVEETTLVIREAEIDEEGNELLPAITEVIPKHSETRFILNPEYDPEKEYISREYRKEWSAVGMMGKLVVVDDGTCEVNSYCKVAENGTATASTTGYRVLKRIDETHIKILFR